MPTVSRSTARISPSAPAPRSRCRCCFSNWRRIPTRACRWSASTRTSSPTGKSTARSGDAMFHFRWEEFNTSAATRREDSDFGLILLDRVAPEALGGTAKRYFTDVSYVYELTAPMVTVVDMTERDRTEQTLRARAAGEGRGRNKGRNRSGASSLRRRIAARLLRMRSLIHGTLSAVWMLGNSWCCRLRRSRTTLVRVGRSVPTLHPGWRWWARARARNFGNKKGGPIGPPFSCQFDSIISRRCRRSRRGWCCRVRNLRRRRHRAGRSASSARG